MNLAIKKYDKKHDPQLENLWAINNEDTYLIDIIHSSHLQFAYGAYQNDQLIGILFTWKNSFHPNCLYFRNVLHPDFHPQEAAEMLLDKVKETEEISLPLQTSVWESSLALNTFYKRAGFREIRRTYMPTLQMPDMPVDDFCNETDYPIKSLSTIADDGILTDDFVQMVKANYEATHTVNPVASMNMEQWKKVVFSDDLLMDLSYVCLSHDEKSILAYALLHESGEDNTHELGWCGTAYQQDIRLVLPLVSKQIKQANQDQVPYLACELDTTDQWAMEIFKNFPFKPCPALVTYSR